MVVVESTVWMKGSKSQMIVDGKGERSLPVLVPSVGITLTHMQCLVGFQIIFKWSFVFQNSLGGITVSDLIKCSKISNTSVVLFLKIKCLTDRAVLQLCLHN